MAARLNPQALAARALALVVTDKRFLDAALEETLGEAPTARPLVQEIVYGTARHWHEVAALARTYLQRPLKTRDSDVHALLLAGFYQLREMRAPEYAVVAESVEAAAQLGKPWAKGLINACLRQYLRDPAAGEQAIGADPEAMHNHPRWLIEAVAGAWPQQWQSILAANNARPPLTLRVNARRVTREAYLAELAAHGIEATVATCAAHGVTLTQPLPVERLPGFREGRVSVQDAAAQLAAPLLDVPRGARVLDACAAPGGKTAHILETSEPDACVAVEIDAPRAQRLRAGLARLGLCAEVVNADAGCPQRWWDGAPFDRILLDVPCSASGVIRRHPDIKLRRRPQDLRALRDTQRQLLAALWPLLAPGGKLLYVTCSILPDENEHQLEAFLRASADAVELPLGLSLGAPRSIGWQLLPGDPCGERATLDGFYYACLAKR